MGSVIGFGLAALGLVLTGMQPAAAQQSRGQLTVGAKVVAPCSVRSDSQLKQNKPQIYISCPALRRSDEPARDQGDDKPPQKYEISRTGGEVGDGGVVEVRF